MFEKSKIYRNILNFSIFIIAKKHKKWKRKKKKLYKIYKFIESFIKRTKFPEKWKYYYMIDKFRKDIVFQNLYFVKQVSLR